MAHASCRISVYPLPNPLTPFAPLRRSSRGYHAETRAESRPNRFLAFAFGLMGVGVAWAIQAVWRRLR